MGFLINFLIIMDIADICWYSVSTPIIFRFWSSGVGEVPFLGERTLWIPRWWNRRSRLFTTYTMGSIRKDSRLQVIVKSYRWSYILYNYIKYSFFKSLVVLFCYFPEKMGWWFPMIRILFTGRDTANQLKAFCDLVFLYFGQNFNKTNLQIFG